MVVRQELNATVEGVGAKQKPGHQVLGGTKEGDRAQSKSAFMIPRHQLDTNKKGRREMVEPRRPSRTLCVSLVSATSKVGLNVATPDRVSGNPPR